MEHWNNNNNNNNNGPSGGQRGVEKSVSYIAGFVVQGYELRIPITQVLWELWEVHIVSRSSQPSQAPQDLFATGA